MALVLGVVFLAGCAGTPRVPSPPTGLAPGMTAADLVALLHERDRAMQTMKALFSIEAKGAAIKGTQRMEAALVYQRPDLLHLRTFARMGLPLFELAVSGGQYQLKIPMRGKLQKGRVEDWDRHEVLGVPVMLGVLATVGPAGSAISSAHQLALREEGGHYILDVLSADGEKTGSSRFWFDRRTGEVIRQDFLGTSGEVRATILFQDHRPVGRGREGGRAPIVRPYRVLAEDARGRAHLVLTFHEIVPNPDLRDEELALPTGKPHASGDEG